MNKQQRLRTDERGVASILFSMVMILVISLIVLAFAQLARRGQREVLDTQLSTQAYYAAESGVNDALAGINVLLPSSADLSNTGCNVVSNTGYAPYLYKQLGATSSGVSYTCVDIDPTPDTLSLTSLGMAKSKILNITPVSAINTLELSWSVKDSSGFATKCPPLTAVNPAQSAWTCPYGMLRFDLVPTNGGLSREGLLANTLTVFAVPVSGAAASSVDVGSGSPQLQQGNRVPASCNAAKCTLTITGATAPSYAMRIIGKYADADSISLTGYNSASPSSPTDFKDGQAVIDSTGKAQNVLRRIQVRVSLSSNGSAYPDSAIESQGSVCKHFTIGLLGTINDDSTCPSFP